MFTLAPILWQLPNVWISWDIAICLPSRIFGKGGILALKQSQIESLSITTDCVCNDAEYQAGLYELKSLKHLCWRVPSLEAARDLSAMIYVNSDTLRHLEVDLVDSGNVDSYVSGPPYEAGPDGLAHSHLFWREFLGKISGPAYPALQTLCLTQVDLRKRSVRALDFNVLRTLKLRDCVGWKSFLRDAVQLRSPVGLKTLELQARFNRINYAPHNWTPGSVPGDNWDPNVGWKAGEVVSNFLAAFTGLKELYVNLKGPSLFDKLWPGVIAHSATLERFVHDLRTLNHSVDFAYLLDTPTGEGIVFTLPLDELRFQLRAEGLSIWPEHLLVSVPENNRYGDEHT